MRALSTCAVAPLQILMRERVRCCSAHPTHFASLLRTGRRCTSSEPSATSLTEHLDAKWRRCFTAAGGCQPPESSCCGSERLRVILPAARAVRGLVRTVRAGAALVRAVPAGRGRGGEFAPACVHVADAALDSG